jgi:hypothetical protein
MSLNMPMMSFDKIYIVSQIGVKFGLYDNRILVSFSDKDEAFAYLEKFCPEPKFSEGLTNEEIFTEQNFYKKGRDDETCGEPKDSKNSKILKKVYKNKDSMFEYSCVYIMETKFK